MKIVVDSTIVFSGILNSNGKIGDLLISSTKHFNFIALDFLHAEIGKHYSRLCKISGLSTQQIHEAEFQICRNITFIWMSFTNFVRVWFKSKIVLYY